MQKRLFHGEGQWRLRTWWPETVRTLSPIRGRGRHREPKGPSPGPRLRHRSATKAVQGHGTAGGVQSRSPANQTETGSLRCRATRWPLDRRAMLLCRGASGGQMRCNRRQEKGTTQLLALPRLMPCVSGSSELPSPVNLGQHH